MKFLRTILLCILLAVGAVSATPAEADTRNVKAFVDITMVPAHTGQPGELTLDALEAAQILKILPMVERLRREAVTASPPSKIVSQMRLLVICRIMAASEEVRKLVASINRDLASANIALSELSAKRARTGNMITAATFTQGGILGVLGKSGQLAGYPPQSAVKVVTASSIAIGLSTVNMFVTPHLYHSRIDNGPNSMTNFLSLNLNPPDANRSYLWQYFNQPVLGSPITITRRELLLKHWKAFLGFDATNKLSVQKMSGLPDGAENVDEGIGRVNERIALLHDLESHVEEFDTSLYELHKSIEQNDVAQPQEREVRVK